MKYIYSQRKVTALRVEKGLNLSRPTVTQIMKELLEEDIIVLDGHAQSTGGRKANLYAYNMAKRIAIGVELRIDSIEIVAINLDMHMMKYETHFIPFRNKNEYFDETCAMINAFIEELKVDKEQLLGVGIGLQALVSTDGEAIAYGKILDCTGMKLEEFTSRISYPCKFNHDAESLAHTELWLNQSLHNAIFFNIRDQLSGTVIINRMFPRGTELKSGVFEHMTLIPEGRKCYCGKDGCVNEYCSFSALVGQDEDIESFFSNLQNGQENERKKWNKFLKNLSLAIDNLHMILPYDVIIGGEIAKFFTQQDLMKLYEYINERTAFSNKVPYVYLAKGASLPLCLGAAIPLVQRYLNKLFIM